MSLVDVRCLECGKEEERRIKMGELGLCDCGGQLTRLWSIGAHVVKVKGFYPHYINRMEDYQKGQNAKGEPATMPPWDAVK